MFQARSMNMPTARGIAHVVQIVCRDHRYLSEAPLLKTCKLQLHGVTLGSQSPVYMSLQGHQDDAFCAHDRSGRKVRTM